MLFLYQSLVKLLSSKNEATGRSCIFFKAVAVNQPSSKSLNIQNSSLNRSGCLLDRLIP